jgi:hypothetical protein
MSLVTLLRLVSPQRVGLSQLRLFQFCHAAVPARIKREYGGQFWSAACVERCVAWC